MLIQLKYRSSSLRRTAGHWAAAVLCGSIVAACSGTIDTPDEENPPRTGERTQSPTPTAPNRTGSTTTPRAPAAPADDEEEEDDDTPAPPPAPAVTPEAPAAEEEEEPVVPEDLTFASDIWPIFNSSCGPCHVDLNLGGQNIGATNKGAAFDQSVDLEDAVLGEIEAGDMPPACNKGAPGDPSCLSVADAAKIEAWYEAGAPE